MKRAKRRKAIAAPKSAEREDSMEASTDTVVTAAATEPVKSNATVLKRTKRIWIKDELDLLESLGTVKINRGSGKIVAVEGCHDKAVIAEALKLDPEQLGENDFGCEFGQVKFG